LLRSKYEPMVGGFLDPMTVTLDAKLLVKAVCEEMVSGIRKRRPREWEGLGEERIRLSVGDVENIQSVGPC
jgi:hypothetical protein